MLNHLADFFLFFSHIWVIFGFVLLYLLWVSRAFFMQSLALLMIDMMVNVALKGTFKIPLNALLHEGYAFPSGHMQVTTVFYGWLALHVPSWAFRALMLGVCLGQGFGLIHYQYHNLEDVIGGFCVALLLIALYRWFLICFSTLCMVYNAQIYHNAIPLHAMQAYELLIGVLLCERVFSKNGKNTQDWHVIPSIKVNFL
jgi:hypothetical protein